MEKIYLIGDTETAGLGPYKKAVEVAFMHIDPITLEVLEEWDSLIDPEIAIQKEAFEIHGISDEMVLHAPTMREYVKGELSGGINHVEIILIGHNVGFDLPLLEPTGNIVGTLCTLQMARDLVKDSANHKLQTLKAHFGLPDSAAHRAAGDVRTTYELLKVLLNMRGHTLEEAAKAAKTPPIPQRRVDRELAGRLHQLHAQA
jgi:DNA polymerase III subunit epsilon